MAHMDSDRGIDKGEAADRSRSLGDEWSYREAMAPMIYEFAFVRDGEIVVDEVKCSAPERVEKAREKWGIDLDNDRVARRSMEDRYGAKWTTPIGDPELCEFLLGGR